MNVETERRMIETIAGLAQVRLIEMAVTIAQYQPELHGRAGILITIAVRDLHERIMDGRLNLTQASLEDIEDTINICIANAARRLVSGIGGGRTPPMPSSDSPLQS
jgi:hypothetical protein